MDRLVFFGSFNKSLFAHLHKDKDDVHPSLKEDWIAYRHKIWRKYTWNSIQRQKNPNWTYVLGCHADTRYLIEKYFSDIKDKRLMIIYTDEEKKHVDEMAKTADTIILCRIDSDDMYHPNVAFTKNCQIWFYSFQCIDKPIFCIRSPILLFHNTIVKCRNRTTLPL